MNRLAAFTSLLLVNAAILISATAATVNPPLLTDSQIQAALDKLPDGGQLVLAAGIYQIHSPLILRRDGITLSGSGPDTILHLADQANCPVIVMGAPKVRHPTSHLHVANLAIDGNRTHQRDEFWRSAADGSQLNNNGIDIWNVNDSSVEHVICRACRSGGLVTAVVHGLTVRDFTACDSQFDGLACYNTEQSRFTGLKLHDNLAAGISLDLSFNHNVIEDAVLAGNMLGVFMRHSSENSFQNVTIAHSRNQGIFMAQTGMHTSSGWALAPGSECVGNAFEKLTITECGGDAFTIHNVSCKNNAIHTARFLKNKMVSIVPTQITMDNVQNVPLP